MTGDQKIEADVRRTIRNLAATLERAAPVSGSALWSWIKDNSPDGDVESFFNHPDRFPFLKLPYWILSEHQATPECGRFLEALTQSSICGYCHIRLLDDVMDERDAKAASLLSLGPFLQAEFMSPYWEYFPSGSDVRTFVKDTWAAAAEWTFRDALCMDIEEADFLEVCAKKMSATNMPVFAACHFRGDRVRDARTWLSLVEALGAFEQFMDDFFDWHIDLQNDRTSYLLSEARRRTDSADGQVQWILTEGMTWVQSQLQRLHARARLVADELGSGPACQHLDSRWTFVERTMADLASGTQSLAAIHRALASGEN